MRLEGALSNLQRVQISKLMASYADDFTDAIILIQSVISCYLAQEVIELSHTQEYLTSIEVSRRKFDIFEKTLNWEVRPYEVAKARSAVANGIIVNQVSALYACFDNFLYSCKTNFKTITAVMFSWCFVFRATIA